MNLTPEAQTELDAYLRRMRELQSAGEIEFYPLYPTG